MNKFMQNLISILSPLLVMLFLPLAAMLTAAATTVMAVGRRLQKAVSAVVPSLTMVVLALTLTACEMVSLTFDPNLRGVRYIHDLDHETENCVERVDIYSQDEYSVAEWDARDYEVFLKTQKLEDLGGYAEGIKIRSYCIEKTKNFQEYIIRRYWGTYSAVQQRAAYEKYAAYRRLVDDLGLKFKDEGEQ